MTGLFHCPRCNKRISPTATVCPGCGEQLGQDWSATARPEITEGQAGIGCLLLILGPIVIGVAIWIITVVFTWVANLFGADIVLPGPDPRTVRCQEIATMDDGPLTGMYIQTIFDQCMRGD